MKSFQARFGLVSELLKLAERAHIYKLKRKNPDVTREEILAELNRWYKSRPGAEHGDGVGRSVDAARFR